MNDNLLHMKVFVAKVMAFFLLFGAPISEV
jgi:hypothetical protein